MKFFSLLKAVLTQDMNLFKYKAKANSSKFKKMLLPISLFILLGFSVGFYAYGIAEQLKPLNLTFIMLTIFLTGVTIFTFMEGIYKSQGILFDSKDNDLLFSLPIKRSSILTVRIIKLLLFEYLYNLMFFLPAIVVYVYFETPSISFYLITFLITILIPIIPTIVACFLGYIIKLVSSKVPSKKVIQTLLTGVLMVGIIVLSTKTGGFINNIAKNANSINDFLTKLYYPIGAYINLITKFDMDILIKLILIHIIPLVLFIILGQALYFRIISSFKGSSTSKKKTKNKINIKAHKPIVTLTKKELKRYFSSTIYIFNTAAGMIMIAFATVLLCTKGEGSLGILADNAGNPVMSLGMLYYAVVFFALAFTSISSSSISLEGKTINITKTLPIDYRLIFKSKILTCFILELPIVLISELVFVIRFNMGIIYLLQLIGLSLVVILFNAVVGLIVNLKFPKLNASSDTEVVKQSMSATISLMAGFIVFLLCVLGISYFDKFISEDILMLINIILLFVISAVLYTILMKNGPKEYQKLNV